MEFNIYVNTTRKLARAELTGIQVPKVAPIYQTHLLLKVWFFEEGEAPALLDNSAAFVVAFKDKADPESNVLAQLTAPTATGSDNYEFEWARLTSAALGTLLGKNASVPTILEIVWVIDGAAERVQIDCSIANAWSRISDTAPDLTPFEAIITAGGFLRLVKPDGNVFNLPLNTGEPPA